MSFYFFTVYHVADVPTNVFGGHASVEIELGTRLHDFVEYLYKRHLSDKAM